MKRRPDCIRHRSRVRHPRSARLAALHPATLTLALLAAHPAASAASPDRYAVEFLSGTAAHLRTPLSIRQEAEPVLEFTPVYRTRAWSPPIYWALRATRRTAAGAWSIELMHHKVYARDLPAEVQSFSVSHGFNFITVQRAWPHPLAELRAGAGIVLAHSESTVRGRRYDERQGAFRAGYHIAGPAALAGAGRSFSPWPWLPFTLEARASVAPARVPIDAGDARFIHVALHVLVGVGVERRAEPIPARD